MRLRNGIDLNCEICNKIMYITPSRLLKNKYHTCSKLCSGKLSSKIQSKKISTECTFCKKEILYKKSVFEKIANPTCSMKCFSEIKKHTMKGQNNPKALHLNDMERFFWEKTKNCEFRTKNTDIPFDLDYLYLLDLYNKQNGKCFYSNLPMKLRSDKNRESYGAEFDVLSIDKIDPIKGYTKGNIVLCLNSINMFKSEHKMEDIKKVFRAIYMKEKNNITVKAKKLFEDSKLPIHSDNMAAGYDIFVHRFEEFDNYIKVYTGISIQPELGTYFMIAPRSSIYKRGLTLYNNLGIIDVNYTGELMGMFLKTKDYKNDIKVGERLMQLIPQEQIWVEFLEVDELSETTRGTAGFGSSGPI